MSFALDQFFGAGQILAGFRDVTGDVVVTLDADLRKFARLIPAYIPTVFA